MRKVVVKLKVFELKEFYLVKLHETSYICARQVLHDQLLLNPPRAGTQQE